MEYFYDLHLHSCLSPCGDADMTPFNLVNMAALKGLGLIALTDHNSCKNCPAALEAAKPLGITVLPGMELCTAEDIHVVCLFPDLDRAMAFDAHVYQNTPDITNKPEVFGEQLIMNESDEVIGKENKLLITSSFISIDNTEALVKEFGGVSFPAHIDKQSNSVLANFGVFPPEIGFSTVEVTSRADIEQLKAAHPALVGMRFLRNSDAHFLWDIHEAINAFDSRDVFSFL